MIDNETASLDKTPAFDLLDAAGMCSDVNQARKARGNPNQYDARTTVPFFISRKEPQKIRLSLFSSYNPICSGLGRCGHAKTHFELFTDKQISEHSQSFPTSG